MPATSTLANKTGKARRCSSAKERAAAELFAASTFTATILRLSEANADLRSRRSLSKSRLGKEVVAQKLRSARLPLKELRLRIFPERSINEKLGAFKGWRSQVSGSGGSGSIFGEGPAFTNMVLGTNGLALKDSVPSSTSMKWSNGKFSNACKSPFGQRIFTRMDCSGCPTPKNTSLE